MPIRSTHGTLPAVIALTGVLALSACSTTTVDPLPPESSSPANGANAWSEELINGPTKPEDLVELSSGAIVVSGMSANPGSEGGGTGSLYAMDPDTDELTAIWPQADHDVVPDRDRFPRCPGPPDKAVASPHGLGLETADDGTEYLYVVNHGGRESVEVFEVSAADAADTRLTWVGCAALPEGSFGNGVAPDPQGDGFYVTHFLNPAEMEVEFERAFAGEPTGHVLHWSPSEDWRTIPESEMSTPNGVAVSEDGQSLYVASWGGRELVELDPRTGERRNSVPMDLMPDNLRPTEDGRLLVTGQVIDSFETFVSYEFEGQPPEPRYDVYALSPDEFTLAPVATGGIDGFGNPTTALEVGGELLVGSVAGDKILRLTPA